MGMAIGSYNTGSVSIPSRKNGMVTGTISYSRPTTKNNKTKKKRLAYSFKKISSQIMTAKTSRNASKAARDARTTMVMLLLKQRSGDYDEKEVKLAIEHAKEMERIAKKKRKHMEQEERAQKTGSAFVEEDADVSEEEAVEEEAAEQEEQQQAEASAEELEQLAREMKQLVEEASQEMRDLAQELVDVSYGDMDKEEVEAMKRKHRAEELHDLIEADMKYLRAVFEKLAKEKQQNASAGVNYDSGGNDNSGANMAGGVSLELAGASVPVEVSGVPVAVEGASVDAAV